MFAHHLADPKARLQPAALRKTSRKKRKARQGQGKRLKRKTPTRAPQCSHKSIPSKALFQGMAMSAMSSTQGQSWECTPIQSLKQSSECSKTSSVGSSKKGKTRSPTKCQVQRISCQNGFTVRRHSYPTEHGLDGKHGQDGNTHWAVRWTGGTGAVQRSTVLHAVSACFHAGHPSFPRETPTQTLHGTAIYDDQLGWCQEISMKAQGIYGASGKGS